MSASKILPGLICVIVSAGCPFAAVASDAPIDNGNRTDSSATRDAIRQYSGYVTDAPVRGDRMACDVRNPLGGIARKALPRR